jgi:hypothetical protein
MQVLRMQVFLDHPTHQIGRMAIDGGVSEFEAYPWYALVCARYQLRLTVQYSTLLQ